MERGHVLMIDLIESIRTTPGKMIVVGCCEDPIPDLYASKGWEVWGYDFRPYQDVKGNRLEPKFNFIQGDFCEAELPLNYFDVAVDTSAIHHFGIGWYGDPKSGEHADTVAATKLIDSLKPGGSLACFTEVGTWEPSGGTSSHGSKGHWRRYDEKQLRERIIQDLEVVREEYWTAAATKMTDKESAYKAALQTADHVCLVCQKP